MCTLQLSAGHLDLLDLEDVAVDVGGDLLLDQRRLAGVGAVEDVVDFLPRELATATLLREYCVRPTSSVRFFVSGMNSHTTAAWMGHQTTKTM
jgi:hypothetical protein